MDNKIISVLGSTDIMLVDHIMRGTIGPSMRVLDAGCGRGRNLHWFLQNWNSANSDVSATGAKPFPQIYGVDADEAVLSDLCKFVHSYIPDYPMERFFQSDLSALSFENASFDLVICNAVLHFARDESHFTEMLDELWRVLAPGGVLFIRTAGMSGIENDIKLKHNLKNDCEKKGCGWYTLPDGSDRFLVDHDTLKSYTQKLGGTLVDPIKSVNVDSVRTMSTWVLRK